jgi:hypothetical protein
MIAPEGCCSERTLHTLSSPCDTSPPVLSTCYQALSQLLSCHIPHLLICLLDCDSAHHSTPRDWYHHSNRISSRELDTITRIRYYLEYWILSQDLDIISEIIANIKLDNISRIRYYLANWIISLECDIISQTG